MSIYDITFENKEDLRDTGLPRKNTVTAEDLNEIKTKHNALAAASGGSTPTIKREGFFSLDALADGSDPTVTGSYADFEVPTFKNVGTGTYNCELPGEFAGIVVYASLSIEPSHYGNEMLGSAYKLDDNTIQMQINSNMAALINGFVGTLKIEIIPG